MRRPVTELSSFGAWKVEGSHVARHVCRADGADAWRNHCGTGVAMTRQVEIKHGGRGSEKEK